MLLMEAMPTAKGMPGRTNSGQGNLATPSPLGSPDVFGSTAAGLGSAVAGAFGSAFRFGFTFGAGLGLAALGLAAFWFSGAGGCVAGIGMGPGFSTRRSNATFTTSFLGIVKESIPCLWM